MRSLPYDAMCQVVGNINDISNFSLMSISKQYILCVKDVHNLEPGVPLLITSREDNGVFQDNEETISDRFGLHTVDKQAKILSYQCSLGILSGRSWLCSKHDWLLTIDNSYSLNLINPITGKIVDLPPVDITDQQDIDIFSSINTKHYSDRMFVQRAVLCKTPMQMDGPFVILILSVNIIMFTKKGEDKWIILRLPACFSFLRFTGAILIGTNVVAAGVGGVMKSWDIYMRPCFPNNNYTGFTHCRPVNCYRHGD